MAAKRGRKKTRRASAPPTLHEAELASGASGVVYRGGEIDLAAAVARRRAGLDVVICGEDINANRALARTVEAAVGPLTRPQAPHEDAGPHALPHFHQRTRRSPEGHCFYETDNPRKKARRKP